MTVARAGTWSVLTALAGVALLAAVSCAESPSPAAFDPAIGPAIGPAIESRVVFASPFVTYEAESGTFSGSVVGPGTTYHTVESEASGRKYVHLAATGNFVQWVTTAAGNGLNIRYNMPDAAGGGGMTGTLSLYVNGTKVQTLNLSSKFAWVYGDTVSNPVWYSNSPSAGSPHRFFDQTHFLLGATIPVGATVKLQKDAGDSAAYYNIDFIDLEAVPGALGQPAGSQSITSFGAVANDGNDDTAAFNSAVNAAGNGGTVWIPAGTFTLNSRPNSFPANVTIRGAGMWYSVLDGLGASFTPNAKTIKLFDFAMSGGTTLRDDSQLQAGIDAGGNGFGAGSVVQNMWFYHLKVGIWTGPMTPGLAISNSRIWDTYADGINLFNGTSNSSVTNTSVRDTGDDGIAIWSGGGNACNNNTITGNLVQFPIHANGIAIYGGSGNTVQDNTVNDIVQYGSGIYIANRFGEVPFSGTTTVTGNTLNRAGSFDPDYGFGDGGFRLEANDANMTGTYMISNNTVDSPTYAGVLFVGSGSITGVTFTNLLINAQGTSGIEVRNNARGSATLTGSTYGTINNAAGANFTITSAGSGGATGAGGGTVTPVGPAGYTYVADENASFTIPAVGDVAYGAGTSFNFRFAVSGSITFNNATFQDPAPGAAKHGFYRAGPAGPPGYTYCAPDLGSFTLPFTSDIAYGANGAFAFLSGKTGTVTFSPAAFGGDPAPGVVKAGFYQAAKPDLVVTGVTWSPASPAAGSGVLFTATIKNQGGGATPGNVKHGVAFSVDGTEVTWSDNDFSSLAAGATVTLTANGGISGLTWAATAGTHTIAATIDDQHLIVESNEANNTFTTSLTVGGGGGGGFPVAGTWYKILSRSSGKALEIGGQSTNDGAGADQWDYLSQSNQKWQFVATDSGFYEVVVQNSNKALDVDAASTADHAKVQQWTYGGGTNQQFAVVDLGGGFYKIMARHSGKVLDVAGAGSTNGVQVYQNTYGGTTNQQWTIVTAN